MAWFKKKEVIPAERKLVSEITINFKEGDDLSFTCVVKSKARSDLVYPWAGFIKWYHAREDSECFTVRCKNGLTMVMKENITGYNMRIRSTVA